MTKRNTPQRTAEIKARRDAYHTMTATIPPAQRKDFKGSYIPAGKFKNTNGVK